VFEPIFGDLAETLFGSDTIKQPDTW
jgi:hypothetical protein